MDGDCPLTRRALRWLLLLGILAPAASRAGTLEEVIGRGYFVWGADAEGGGPYVFPDDVDKDRMVGFEVELAGLLAGELAAEAGKAIEARFFQGDWDTLPELLDAGRVDVVLNGYEWTPARARRMGATVPYYIYELQLLVRAGDERIRGWDDLAGSPPRKVGILGGSATEIHLKERYGDTGEKGVEIISYDGNTDAMSDVVTGKLDATLQDLPIAVHYREDFPTLEAIGAPVAPGRYVMFVRMGDGPFLGALNRALLSLRGRGELRRLYERWGIWTSIQDDDRYFALPDAGGGSERPPFLARHGRTLLRAAGMTVFLSVASMPLAIILGLLVAIGRLYGPRSLSIVLRVYVEVIRGTPLLLQLFVIFFLLPRLGIVIEAVPAAILGLAINYSAYEAEIYRAGLQAVPAGQMEAALSLGMSRSLALRRILVPQAIRIVIPPVTNDFIALFKDTSVCSVITVVELTKQYNIAAMNDPGELVPLAAVSGLLYLAMSYPLSILASRMERRLSR